MFCDNLEAVKRALSVAVISRADELRKDVARRSAFSETFEGLASVIVDNIPVFSKILPVPSGERMRRKIEGLVALNASITEAESINAISKLLREKTSSRKEAIVFDGRTGGCLWALIAFVDTLLDQKHQEFGDEDLIKRLKMDLLQKHGVYEEEQRVKGVATEQYLEKIKVLDSIRSKRLKASGAASGPAASGPTSEAASGPTSEAASGAADDTAKASAAVEAARASSAMDNLFKPNEMEEAERFYGDFDSYNREMSLVTKKDTRRASDTSIAFVYGSTLRSLIGSVKAMMVSSFARKRRMAEDQRASGGEPPSPTV